MLGRSYKAFSSSRKNKLRRANQARQGGFGWDKADLSPGGADCGTLRASQS